ncbi:MAG: methylmalonyl Co-A mutase-associated GTPase MeaB [Flavisolibacter sp.]
MWQKLLSDLQLGDTKALARSISLIENELPGYQFLMESLSSRTKAKIIGITGPPGAGKSTLTDALIKVLVQEGKRVAVLCVDPSSPFNLGAVLGDRIRMRDWYNHKNVFIRSLATRGALGGLHPKIIEITELVMAANYDFILLETVGVGQSEIEIAGVADTTIVVLVPEGGDEVQTMKAGLMEIADIFVVNKGDRPDADQFVAVLKAMIASGFRAHEKDIPVIKTTARDNVGISALYDAIKPQLELNEIPSKKLWLYTEKVWQLIQKNRMAHLDKHLLKSVIEAEMNKTTHLNLYLFSKNYF